LYRRLAGVRIAPMRFQRSGAMGFFILF
jgi:hypothetical protein